MDPVTIGLLVAGMAAGAGASIFGATQQTKAAQAATAAQQAMFAKIQQQMSPYINFGANWGIPGYQQATQQLETAIPGLTAPMTAADVASTPGFQFMEQQGQEDVSSAMAKMGLGSSGAAAKGAAQYETGLASTTIPQWLTLLLGQRNQIYNMLTGAIQPYTGAVNAGAGAAGALGQMGVATGQGVASNMLGAGNAAAAAGMNIGQSFGQLPSQYLQYSLASKLMGQGNPAANVSSPLGVPSAPVATGIGPGPGTFAPTTGGYPLGPGGGTFGAVAPVTDPALLASPLMPSM